MLIWTNRPYETMWEYLNFFSFKANVRNLLSGKISSKRNLIYAENDPLLDKKSTQITHSIKHACEYFKAADTVTINTSPLLYFYGMLSLAKALLIANNSSILLNNINYHGLTTKAYEHIPGLKAYVNDEAQWCIEKEYAVTNGGVFKELTKLIHNFEFVDTKSIIRYKDLLSLDPEISEIYQRYYNLPSKLYYCYNYAISEDPFVIELSPSTTDRNNFETVFPEILNDFDFIEENLRNRALLYRSKGHVTSIPDYFGIYEPIAGGQYIIGGLNYEEDKNQKSKYISLELCDYINMFILSDCVRYKQEFWGKIVQGEIDGVLGLVNLSISVARIRFPNFILRELLNEKVAYGQAGRWT